MFSWTTRSTLSRLNLVIFLSFQLIERLFTVSSWISSLSLCPAHEINLLSLQHTWKVLIPPINSASDRLTGQKVNQKQKSQARKTFSDLLTLPSDLRVSLPTLDIIMNLWSLIATPTSSKQLHQQPKNSPKTFHEGFHPLFVPSGPLEDSRPD